MSCPCRTRQQSFSVISVSKRIPLFLITVCSSSGDNLAKAVCVTGVMAEIGQLRNTMAMKRAFDKIMMFHNNMVEITVTIAKEWDDAAEKEVRGVLDKMTKEQGVTYSLIQKTDPSIIDGYVFQVSRVLGYLFIQVPCIAILHFIHIHQFKKSSSP